MATEIEVKYLVKSLPDLTTIKHEKIVQGYLRRSHGEGLSTVRVRQLGDKGFMTVKGDRVSISQKEWEWEIPVEQAKEMFEVCEPGILEKTRYYILHGNLTIELDIFEGRHKGLIVAEIELSSEDEKFDIPEWFGEDVSKDGKYSNAALSKMPIFAERTFFEFDSDKS